jgi:hypothetical protein
VSGSRAQARPSATNPTVSLGRLSPAHPAGNGDPSASVAPVGEGLVVTVGDTVGLWATVVVFVDVVVHEQRTAMAISRRLLVRTS